MASPVVGLLGLTSGGSWIPGTAWVRGCVGVKLRQEVPPRSPTPGRARSTGMKRGTVVGGVPHFWASKEERTWFFFIGIEPEIIRRIKNVHVS